MARPEVPDAYVARVRRAVARLPECEEEDAWTGVRWRVRRATVAHLFGGEDQRFRLTFRAEPDEVAAFTHLGEPYFLVGGNAVGLVIDADTDWTEVSELVTDSYCLQAPVGLAARVRRPASADGFLESTAVAEAGEVTGQ